MLSIAHYQIKAGSDNAIIHMSSMRKGLVPLASCEALLDGTPIQNGTVQSVYVLPCQECGTQSQNLLPSFRPISPRNSSRHSQKTSTSA